MKTLSLIFFGNTKENLIFLKFMSNYSLLEFKVRPRISFILQMRPESETVKKH